MLAPAQDGKPAEEDAGDAQAHAGLPRAVPAPEALQEEAISEQALTAALQASFGFSSFRRLQLPVIQSVLRGRTTLAIMPTGCHPCSRLSCAFTLLRCKRRLTALVLGCSCAIRAASRQSSPELPSHGCLESCVQDDILSVC